MCADGICMPAGSLGQQGGKAHFLKQIQAVVARRTVSAEPDVDALSGQCG